MNVALTKASQYIVERSKLMIKNNADFVCVSVDLSFSEADELVDPDPETILNWFNKLFTVDLANKPLNQKAIEAMQKKGIQPGKQPGDLQLKVVIVNSTNAVHIAFQGNSDLIKTCSAGINSEVSVDQTDFKVYSCPSEQAFKDRDVYMTLIFQDIKKIYPDFFADED